jgi:hypothetical protein
MNACWNLHRLKTRIFQQLLRQCKVKQKTPHHNAAHGRTPAGHRLNNYAVTERGPPQIGGPQIAEAH